RGRIAGAAARAGHHSTCWSRRSRQCLTAAGAKLGALRVQCSAVAAPDLHLASGGHGLAGTGHSLSQAEPDPEDRRVAGAATLGGAFPDTLKGLADAVLLVAAGQLRVLQVLAVALQSLFVFFLDGDREVAEAHDLQAIGVDEPLDPSQSLPFDLVGVRGDAEYRPVLRHDVTGHVRPQNLQELLTHPVGHLLVGLYVLGPDQVQDQRLGLDHLQRVLAEDAQANSQAGLGVDDIVDHAPEGEVWELTRGDEVDLGLEQVAARRGVDQSAQEGDLGTVEGASPGVDGALYKAVAKENRQLVLLDGELG